MPEDWPPLWQVLNLIKGKNWPAVLKYAESIRDGKKIACIELKQAVDRFFCDLENPDYYIDSKGPEFVFRS